MSVLTKHSDTTFKMLFGWMNYDPREIWPWSLTRVVAL